MRRFLFAVTFIAFFLSFIPGIFAQSNQTVSNGGTTTAVNFSGTGCTYNWVNSNPAIGLPASGTGNIAPFIAGNNTGSPITATITATPAVGGYAYITNFNNGTVSVINTANNVLVTTIPVGNGPFGVSVSPDGSIVYVTNRNDYTVSKISTASNTVIATIRVGAFPWAVSITPNGKYVYVTNSQDNTVSVIDNTTNSVITTINVDNNPIGVTVSPDGNLVYVACYTQGTISVINTTTNKVVSTIQAGLYDTGIVVSPDGSRVYVSDSTEGIIYVIDATTDKVISNITVGSACLSLSISPDGTRIYVVNQGSDTVSVINTSNNQVISTITLGLGPTGSSITSDGKWLYVTNQADNTLSIINTVTNTVTSTIPTGQLPISFGTFISPAAPCNGSPVTFTITVNPTLTLAIITASPATGTISACVGTASASPNIQQFTVSGSNLSAAVTATAPIGFEVSLTPGSGYGNSVTVNQTAGNLSNTTIYVRSAANDPDGPISGNVILSSTGAANQTVLVSGVINALPTANTVPNQTVSNGAATTAVNFTGTGNTFTWTNDTPGIGLATNGTGNTPSFTAVNNTASPIIATITVTPLNNTSCNGTPIIFTITVNPTIAAPTTLTATANLTPLATIYGTPSSSESFTVSGTNISGGISVTPPAGFEVSSNGTAFKTTTTITGNGNISSAPVYIRLAATTPVGNYSGNIVLSTTNTASINVFMPNSTVSPTLLTITADNLTKLFGAVNPPLTVTYAGFVNNDNVSQLTTQPVVTTTALVHSPIGRYPITAKDAVSPNYNFIYLPGVLTIQPSLSSLSIPNTFTPNDDEINDTWEIKYLEYYPKATVNIFDRWGQKVFSSVGYPIPWDGKYKGVILPSGTYYYLIDPKNGQQVFSGWLAIIK